MSLADTALSLDRILSLIDAVPTIDRFPTVDQLVASFDEIAESAPDVVRRRRIGTSRLGEPIHALTIGTGRDHALVIGGVHPNEPIGGETALHLARTLVADEALREELGYTWHIIGCIDPDGMRLNEGWFCGSLDRAEYGRRFFRPASDEQVEWTFPLEYKELYFDRVLPETLALMRLIDEVRPTFTCALHNGELGGVYYYLSHEAPELYPILHAISAHEDLPLDTGEPDMPYVSHYATAIYGHVHIEDDYDYRVRIGMDPTKQLDSGTSSAGYARKYNALALVSELPFWTSPDAADESPTDMVYSDVLRQRAAELEELGTTIVSVLKETASDLRLQSPYLRAMRQFGPYFAENSEQEARRAEHTENNRPATAAEVYTGADIVHAARMRFGGMTLQLLEAEIKAGNGTPRIREQYRRMTSAYDRWAADALRVTPPDIRPIRSLVAVQYGAILAAAAYAVGRHGPES